ncbi:MAG: DUF3047 domain-containing protein [Pseudomonadota bacterium]
MKKLWLFALVLATPAWAAPGLFSMTGFEGWEPQIFKKLAPTSYRLVKDGNTQVVQANCKTSASGLIHEGGIDLTRTPILQWRWKVDRVYSGINEKEKSGDDFPARIYVVRKGGLAIWRTRSVAYTWASQQPKGSHWPNPFARQVHMVAVESGAGKVGKWVTERRDLRADFKDYFELDIETLDGIALMSDCDNAGGAMRAWFGDIKLLER